MKESSMKNISIQSALLVSSVAIPSWWCSDSSNNHVPIRSPPTDIPRHSGWMNESWIFRYNKSLLLLLYINYWDKTWCYHHINIDLNRILFNSFLISINLRINSDSLWLFWFNKDYGHRIKPYINLNLLSIRLELIQE